MRRPEILRNLAALPLCLVLTGTGASAQSTHDVFVVHQRTDSAAANAAHMFRFEPDILVIAPGDTITFLNSLGSHTVMSQKGLWPEAVDTFHIRGQAEADVVFDTPGLYGITCARHGRYGMSMVIAVGDDGVAAAAAVDADDIPATDLAREAYGRQLQEIAAN